MKAFILVLANRWLLSLFITNKQSNGLVSKRSAMQTDIPVSARNRKSDPQSHGYHFADEYTVSLVTQ
jgi:hypothetical protein